MYENYDRHIFDFLQYVNGIYNLDEFRCLEEREQALKTSNESGIPIFVPVCKENGQYVDIQCHQGTGYCWCVNIDGKPVPRSSTKYSKPNCQTTGRLKIPSFQLVRIYRCSFEESRSI